MAAMTMRILQRLSEIKIPQPITHTLYRLPQFPPSLAMATALNLALGEDGIRAIPAELTGRQVCLVVTDLGMELSLVLTRQGFVPPHLPSPTPDVIIKANKHDFLAMATRTEDSDTLFFSRRLTMAGDTELGLLVRNLLDAVDFSALGLKQFLPLRAASGLSRLLQQRRGERWVVW